MKRMFSLLILSITLFSCGGGVDCSCDEIVKKPSDGKYYRSGAYKEGDRVSFGELFTGTCETKYASGEVKVHQEYSNGIKHGLHSEYYDNAQLKEVVEYNEGKRLSKKTYYKSGQLESNIIFLDEYVQSIIEGMMEQKKGDYKLYYESGQLKEEKFDSGLKRYEENGDLTYEEIYEQDYSWSISKDNTSGNRAELSLLTLYRSSGKSLAKIEITGVSDDILTGTIYVGIKNANITKEDIKAFYSKIEEFTDRHLKVALEPWDEWVMGPIRHDFENLSEEYNRIEITNMSDAIMDESTEISDVDDEYNVQLYTISDPDGYSNLRKTPGGDVILKVYEGETFEVLGDENVHKKVKLKDGTIGYIHSSRVVFN